jgi:catechol 2,3-dioxygenase-like lactoylglutathione lyase family enzyme
MTRPALHHTGLTVSDLGRSLTFWRDALGMEVVLDQEATNAYLGAVVGEPGARARAVHLSFPDGGTRVELHDYHAPAGGSVELRAVDVGFAHVAVICDDLDELLARLVEAEGRPISEPVTVDAGANAGARAVYVRDPDGHVLELIEPPQR